MQEINSSRRTMINLSIIIPYFNTVASVSKLLLSIPKSDDIQVIVIDDKSNLNLDEYCRIKEDALFNHILFTENTTNEKGAGVCRNIGLKCATGKWILFADSDDFFIKNFYAKVSRFFETDSDVVFFKPTSLDQLTGKIAYRHITYSSIIDDYLESMNRERELLLRYCFPVPWSKMFKREFINYHNVWFDHTIVSNDVMFSAKSGHYMKKFIASDDTIYCVTSSKGTLTTKKDWENMYCRINVFVSYYHFLFRNLSSKDFNLVNPYGGIYLKKIIRTGYGIKNLLKTYKLFRNENIRILKNSNRTKLINRFRSFVIYHVKGRFAWKKNVNLDTKTKPPKQH